MAKSTESWRVFVAIELPADLRKLIKQHIDRLRAALPNARASWSREDNIHLTLKFLGDIPIATIENLLQATKRAAQSAAPLEIGIEGCDCFPPRGRPSVLWIGVEDSNRKLAELQQGLERECERIGFAREQRLFHPHLTIARLRKPLGGDQLAGLHKEIEFPRADFEASELVVFRSELLPEGSRHTAVARHAFGAI